MLSFRQNHAEIQDILDKVQSGGGGGTDDYTDLSNKPQINSITLTGNKSLSDIGAATATDITAQQAKTSCMGTAGTNYVIINGIRVYVNSTAPTGDIPDGSIWIGG